MKESGIDRVWRRSEFRAYMSATAFAGVSFAMHQLLVSWLFIDTLLLRADRVGQLQALIGIPGVFLMLWGGASADRTDSRGLLIRVYALAPLLPLALVVVDRANWISVATVTLWGLGMSVVMAFSSPAQQAILNRVSGSALQKGVTAATAILFLVQMVGLKVAGQMDRLGLTPVLLVQAASLGMAAVMIRRVSASPPPRGADAAPAWRNIVEGLQAVHADKVVFNVLVLNFVSSIFNAGAFMTVLPFIIKRIYGGDADLLADTMVIFFAGAMVSNLVMLRWMPFTHPGRLFLLMQLSRIAILLLLWIEPSWWLLMVAMVSWGLNMGVTSTLARLIVQESAAPEFRGRVLSVFTVAQIGSPPIGALVLGWIVETFGTLDALLPAMLTSLVIFVYGISATRIWSYRSHE